MNTSLQQADATKGGEWLIKESNPFTTFIPEDFTEEQQMIKDMTNQFINKPLLTVLQVWSNVNKLGKDCQLSGHPTCKPTEEHLGFRHRCCCCC